MDFHEYVTGQLIEAHLAELRAQAARERLLLAGHAPRPGWRVAAGRGLIRLGAWLAVERSGHVAVSNLGR